VLAEDGFPDPLLPFFRPVAFLERLHAAGVERLHVNYGAQFGGMLNLGPRPTVGDHQRRIEAHVFDAGADWYGAAVRLDFVARLRGTRPFPGLDALKAQLAFKEFKASLVRKVSLVKQALKE
jgi:FAD synthase